MKKTRGFLLAFAVLLPILLLAFGIYAASSPTVLPATDSVTGYWQVRENGSETYNLPLVVNANKAWLNNYREAWIDLVFVMPDGGSRSYHGKVETLFSSALVAGKPFQASHTCVLLGIVVTDIPYEPLSASATLTLSGYEREEKTVSLGSVELPQKGIPSYITVNADTLRGLIAGKQAASVLSVTFGNWERYASEVVGASFPAWESGEEAGAKPDTVRVFRVPRGNTVYDVYILSKTGRVALPADCSGLFRYLHALKSLHADDLDTSAVTDMSEMFSGCNSLADLTSLAGWDVSRVTDMAGMFSCSYDFPSVLADLTPLANWDVSHVTDMREMFAWCTSLTNLAGLTDWNIASAANMSGMFQNCRALASADLSGWNTAHVTDMSKMFQDCFRLETIYVSNYFAVPMSPVWMFDHCTALSGKYWNGSEYAVKTPFDPVYTDGTYAKLCSAAVDGYFTLKAE